MRVLVSCVDITADADVDADAITVTVTGTDVRFNDNGYERSSIYIWQPSSLGLAQRKADQQHAHR